MCPPRRKLVCVFSLVDKCVADSSAWMRAEKYPRDFS